MIRFLGNQFGFDVDTERRVIRIRKLVHMQDEEDWVYADFETPYPIPAEFLKAASAGLPWHVWNAAWSDLGTTNPNASRMLKALVSPPT